VARENEQDGHERTSKFQPGCGGVCGARTAISNIGKAESLGMTALLSDSPLD
jgi:hypothetical protein